MTFWSGLVLGIFVGANVGFIILALCRSASRGDQLMREALAKKGMGQNDG